jgi:hypothetical protein
LTRWPFLSSSGGKIFMRTWSIHPPCGSANGKRHALTILGVLNPGSRPIMPSGTLRIFCCVIVSSVSPLRSRVGPGTRLVYCQN